MARMNYTVTQERPDLAGVKVLYEKVLQDIDAKKAELGTARGRLGKRVLTGEGPLLELSVQLKQTEAELKALEQVRAEGEALFQEVKS